MKEEETEGIPSSFGIKTLLIPYFDLQMNEIVIWYILTGKKFMLEVDLHQNDCVCIPWEPFTKTSEGMK